MSKNKSNTINEHEELPDYESEPEEDNKDQKKTGSNKPLGFKGLHTSTFEDFLLKQELLRGIKEAGFEHPSEVQQECIPQAVHGSDVLCQAKSGMGKTAVFVLSVLNQLDFKNPQPLSTLILAHTRELAYQITSEFERLGKYIPGLKARVFYGGTPKDREKQIEILKKDPPHIVVGTPGRIKDFATNKILDLKNLKFFVVDECDKALEQLDMRKDITDIFTQTPQEKQVMMFSATLPGDIKTVCRRFMQNQIEIAIDDQSKLTLEGLKQYYEKMEENEKNKKLNDLLDALIFNQVIIFVKTIQRAIALNTILNRSNFPSIPMHSNLTSAERIKTFQLFKNFEKRIMVATDLFGRGIDIERINVVINYDTPEDPNTYLHRVGRAGRFGTKGLAITFVSSDDEMKIIKEIQDRFVVKIEPLPETIDKDDYMNN